MPFQQRFENAGLDLQGFWGKPNSSIDWCERNYVVTYYVAEFWNTFSNIFLMISGLMAFIVARRLELETRWQVHGLAWALVGTGSACFHGVLWYSAQLLDELPMIYAALVWCYCMLQIYDDTKAAMLRWGFAAYALIWTVLHANGAFTILFQVQYGLLVLCGVGLTERALRMYTGTGLISFLSPVASYPRGGGLWMLVHLIRWHIVWLIIAFACWITDQAACEKLHTLPLNPQLHAWWHTLVAVSIHIAFHAHMAARAAERRGAIQKASWIWYFYYLPVVADVPPDGME